MRFILLFMLLLVPAIFWAKPNDNSNYAVKDIPAELLKNANVVIREYNWEINVHALNDVLVTEHRVVTILNSYGDKEANDQEDYSDAKTIENLAGNIYDAKGERVEKIKYADFKDIPYFPGYANYSDQKYMVYQPGYRQYPYTVEYKVTYRQKHTFYLNSFVPLRREKTALQHAMLTVTVPATSRLKYKAFIMPAEPVITGDKEKTYAWEINNLKPVKTEPLACNIHDCFPKIMLELSEFLFDTYKGNSNTWSDFGKFVYELNKDRDKLTPAMQAKVVQLIQGVTDDYDKVKILYRYLQKNMRYVSVQIGIGGWQTLTAEDVCSNQYGDCKALSNMMMALLKKAGIRAYCVCIYAGKENEMPMQMDFVSSQFNHVILCVPFIKDTVWLECTANDLPAGYLSNFTQDRDALMITPQGGVVVHTPKYDTTVNVSVHHVKAKYTIAQQAGIEYHNVYYGQESIKMGQKIRDNNEHDRKLYEEAKFQLPGYTISDYQFTTDSMAKYGSFQESAKITASAMVTTTGSRHFISYDLLPLALDIPEEAEDRKTAFFIPESYAICDTFNIQVPETWEIESIPVFNNYHAAFGSYSCIANQQTGSLTIMRKFTLCSGVYDAQSYKDFTRLFELVYKDSQKKAVYKEKK